MARKINLGEKDFWNVLLGFLLGVGMVGLSSCSTQPTESPALLIATAANMQYAMDVLADSFMARTEIKTQLIVGSSGKLTAQIIEGAPFDVFVSADMKYPEEIYRSGRGVAPPQIYVLGSLVLWSMNADIDPTVNLLTSPSVEHIALANPQNAPYGQAAYKFLWEQNLLPQLENKLVYGESISQVNQFVHTEAAEIGFTAKSIVLSQPEASKGKWIELAPESYPPITQGVLLLKNGDAAQKFYQFLFSPFAEELVRSLGYSLPDSAQSQ